MEIVKYMKKDCEHDFEATNDIGIVMMSQCKCGARQFSPIPIKDKTTAPIKKLDIDREGMFDVAVVISEKINEIIDKMYDEQKTKTGD